MSRLSFSFVLAVLIPALQAASQQSTAPAQPTLQERASPPPSPSPATPFPEATRLAEQGKFNEALSLLTSFADKNPGYKGVAHALGVVYYKQGDHVKAIESLKKAVNEDPNDKEAVQLLGLSYYLSGRPAEAIPLLVRVQSWYPVANVDASYILGLCYIQTKDYDHARGAFAKMFGVAPDSAPSHLFVARMLLRQGYDPVAESEAKKAIELDPKLPLAHYLLGELYIFKSRIPEAIAALETEMAINPAHAATYDRLADAYTRVMRWEDAERLLQRAIWLDPTATGPYVLMGKVLLKKNEPNLAARSLQRAVTMDPNNYMGHYLLGQAYNAIGRREDGQRELELSQKIQESQSHSQAELR